MILLLFAALGFWLGYRFHTTNAGYATLGFIALAFPILQIADVVFVRDRQAQTLLPLVVGLTLILFTLAGTGVRVYSARR